MEAEVVICCLRLCHTIHFLLFHLTLPVTFWMCFPSPFKSSSLCLYYFPLCLSLPYILSTALCICIPSLRVPFHSFFILFCYRLSRVLLPSVYSTSPSSPVVSSSSCSLLSCHYSFHFIFFFCTASFLLCTRVLSIPLSSQMESILFTFSLFIYLLVC